MINKIKKFSFPMAVALLAIAGTFANNLSAKMDKTDLVDRLGYTVTCQPTSIMCTNEGGPICKNVNGSTLYDWNGTDCPLPLHKKF